MLKTIDIWARRVVAYPLVALGAALNNVAGWLIVLGAWLLDRDDVVQLYRDIQ